MELIYLWSNEMGILENQGVNFSSRYWVKVEGKDDQNRPKSLKIEKRDGQGGDFFNLEGKRNWPLLEVTGLVGENGAGKTSILRRIAALAFPIPQNQRDSIDAGEDPEILALWMDESSYNVQSEFIFAATYTINSTGKDMLHLFFPEGSPLVSLVPKVDMFDRENALLDVLYYSPVFDGNGVEPLLGNRSAFWKGWVNVSTTSMLKGIKFPAIANGQTMVSLFQSEELRRQSKFVSDLIGNGYLPWQLPFDLPRRMRIGYNWQSQGGLGNEIDESIKELKKWSGPELYLEDTSLKYSWSVIFSSVIKSAGSRLFPLEATRRPDPIRKFFALLMEHEWQEDIISSLETLKSEISDFQPDLIPFWSELIRTVSFLMKDLSQTIIEESRKELKNITAVWLLLNLTRKGHAEFLSGFLDHIRSLIVFVGDNPFEFSWLKENRMFGSFPSQTLSAGETAFLNLFSRLYDGQMAMLDDPEKERNNNRPSIFDRPLLLLLDEPDTLMHPKWQQKLLHWLVQGLPAIFPDRKIQLILTSHSPFVCADLPKEHLVFLRRKENRAEGNRRWKAEVVHPDEMKNTFGANIHKIFTDTQFLGKNLLGEFANRKIKNLIGKVNDFGGGVGEYKELRKQLNQIGEDFIRRKLIKQLDEKDGSRLTQLEKEMKELQDRMENVEQEIKQIRGKEGENGQD